MVCEEWWRIEYEAELITGAAGQIALRQGVRDSYSLIRLLDIAPLVNAARCAGIGQCVKWQHWKSTGWSRLMCATGAYE
jgi:hypothetical protein